MAMNVFNTSGTAYLGTQPFAFDRTKMLAGQPATLLTPGLVGSPANNEDPLMPADFDGSILPPSGAPNTFVEFPDSIGNNNNTYRSWHLQRRSAFRQRPDLHSSSESTRRALHVPLRRRAPEAAGNPWAT